MVKNSYTREKGAKRIITAQMIDEHNKKVDLRNKYADKLNKMFKEIGFQDRLGEIISKTEKEFDEKYPKRKFKG